MAADTLSDVLKTVRLTGATFFDVVAMAPWVAESPPSETILPKILPGAEHLIAYHVVTEGRCFTNIIGEEPIAIEAGEVVVFTKGDPHVLSSSPGMRADPATTGALDGVGASQLPFFINYGEAGPVSAKFVCGFLACDARPFNPLLENLPRVIKTGDRQDTDTGWLGQFIRLAISESADKRSGGESVLAKLSELMFIEVVRRYLEELPRSRPGGSRVCAILSSARPCRCCMEPLRMSGPSRNSAEKSASRAPSWPSALPISSAFRQCNIWPNGGCRSHRGC